MNINNVDTVLFYINKGISHEEIAEALNYPLKKMLSIFMTRDLTAAEEYAIKQAAIRIKKDKELKKNE